MKHLNAGDFIEHFKFGVGKVLEADNNRQQTVVVKFNDKKRQLMITDDIDNKIHLIPEDEIGTIKESLIATNNKAHNAGIIGSHKDGNIAIKCNYCDGGSSSDHIGFSGICSDKTIRYNIEVENRAWCSNEDCPCFQYYKGKISKDELRQIMSTSSGFVCYESTMLSDWMTQAGLTEDRITKKFGSTLHKGAACIFTTRLPNRAEQDRFVFGLFIVDELFHGDDSKSGYVKCNTEYHIELTPEEAIKIRFWDYYRNKNNPEKELWGTGLYRFISNASIISLLNDLLSLRAGEDTQEEVIRFLKEFCRLNQLKIPEISNHSVDKPIRVITRDSFIDSLRLPQQIEAKQFKGMNRVHFKCNGIGFAVIDMKSATYNLASRADYFKAIGFADYELTSNMGPNKAVLRDVEYNDYEVLLRLINYIVGVATGDDSFERERLIKESQILEEEISGSDLVGTDRMAIVKARVNQGTYRDLLIRKFHRCCICGIDDEGLLIASHIKPWADSDGEERVDENNGLLLCPNHDRLFDRGYISFDDDGSILLSKALSEENQVLMNIKSDIKISLSNGSKEYMKYHRLNIYRK